MKNLFIVVGVIVVLTSNAFASEQSMLARITVYWGGEGSGSRASWNGARLRPGHCAVDPKRIPYGSKVLFPDAACLAVDTGPAVVSRTAAKRCARTAPQRSAIVVDRYFETKKEALSWAARYPHYMTVRVVPRNSRSASAERTRGPAPHFLAPSTIPKYVARPAHEGPGWFARYFGLQSPKVETKFPDLLDS